MGADASQTTRELAAKFGISIPTIHLKQIGKVKSLNKSIKQTNQMNSPRSLSFFALLNPRRVVVAWNHFTCAKKWIFFDIRKRTSQWLDKDEAPQQISVSKSCISYLMA